MKKSTEGLHRTIGPRKISKFVEDLVRRVSFIPTWSLLTLTWHRDKKREKRSPRLG